LHLTRRARRRLSTLIRAARLGGLGELLTDLMNVA
jgi:hypothetical protein